MPQTWVLGVPPEPSSPFWFGSPGIGGVLDRSWCLDVEVRSGFDALHPTPCSPSFFTTEVPIGHGGKTKRSHSTFSVHSGGDHTRDRTEAHSMLRGSWAHRLDICPFPAPVDPNELILRLLLQIYLNLIHPSCTIVPPARLCCFSQYTSPEEVSHSPSQPKMWHLVQ